MIETKVPGIKARHTLITPNCRVVQGGAMQAFEKAVQLLRAEYHALSLVDANEKASFHLVLTVDRPEKP